MCQGCGGVHATTFTVVAARNLAVIAGVAGVGAGAGYLLLRKKAKASEALLLGFGVFILTSLASVAVSEPQ